MMSSSSSRVVLDWIDDDGVERRVSLFVCSAATPPLIERRLSRDGSHPRSIGRIRGIANGKHCRGDSSFDA